MMYKRRELRRLWEVEVYNGDPDDPETTTRIESVVAFNHVDAIRKVGGQAVKLPEAKHFVTWPEAEGAPVYRIDDPNEGPVGKPVTPSVAIVEPDEDEWK